MSYGDSESNSYRIGDLTAHVSNLELDLNGFKNNINFEISDLKSSSKYIRSDIEKLVGGQAELKRVVTEQTQEIKNLQKIITMQGKSLAELERFTTETRQSLNQGYKEHETELGIIAQRESDHKKSLKAVRSIVMAEIIAIKPRISYLESALKLKLEKVEKLYTNLMHTPINELVDKIEKDSQSY